MTPIAAWIRPLLLLLAGLSLTSGRLGAEMQTLTDRQGRSINADVLSVADDQVRIKREDGQTFDLALSLLSDADQKKLKEWAEAEAAKPKVIPAGSIEIKVSKAQFKTEKQNDEGLTVSKEDWGYNVDLLNHNATTLTDLHADYILFVKQDDLPGQSKGDRSDELKRSKKRTDIGGLGMRAETKFRTEPVTLFRQKLKPGYVWKDAGGNKPIRDTLYGIWIRIYAGDQLVSEISFPESLAKTEKW